MNEKEQSDFSPVGFAIGFPLGIPIALALGNLALFPVFGLLFGMVLGFAISPKEDEG